MALCPFAVHQLIAPGSNDPRIQARTAIWHVAVSMTASLFLFFRDRSGGIESHFYVNWRGKLFQYRDTGWQADANLEANDFAVSIETAGWGIGRWNKLQRRTMKRLALWLEDAEGIPLRVCDNPYSAGHGYHTQWGAPSPWTPVAKSCPGPQRIRQFHKWFAPWLRKTRIEKLAPKRHKPRLRIRQANLWRENKHIAHDLKVLVKGRPHIVGTNESANFRDELKAIPGYRLVTGKHPRSRTQNGILLRNDLEYLGGGVSVMCEAVGTSPERTAVHARFKYLGQLRAHISTHANSHVEHPSGRARKLPRVRQYVQHMQRLGNLVRQLEGQGYRVTMTGDLNWSWVARRALWKFAPKRVLLRKLGLRSQWGHKTAPSWKRRRIDYIVFNPDDLRIVEQHLVRDEHSDHPWPECTFEIQE